MVQDSFSSNGSQKSRKVEPLWYLLVILSHSPTSPWFPPQRPSPVLFFFHWRWWEMGHHNVMFISWTYPLLCISAPILIGTWPHVRFQTLIPCLTLWNLLLVLGVLSHLLLLLIPRAKGLGNRVPSGGAHCLLDNWAPPGFGSPFLCHLFLSRKPGSVTLFESFWNPQCPWHCAMATQFVLTNLTQFSHPHDITLILVPGILCVLGMGSTTELHPQLSVRWPCVYLANAFGDQWHIQFGAIPLSEIRTPRVREQDFFGVSGHDWHTTAGYHGAHPREEARFAQKPERESVFAED